MLTRVRIEVEEESAAACAEALAKYEHAIQQQEARRYRHLWPISATLDTREGGESKVNTPEDEYPTPDHDWSDEIAIRDFYNSELSREITDEVIEFDASIPAHKGRRVIIFQRIDTRDERFTRIQPVVGFSASWTGDLDNSGLGGSAA